MSLFALYGFKHTHFELQSKPYMPYMVKKINQKERKELHKVHKEKTYMTVRISYQEAEYRE